jgi:hypothetical protein
LMFWGEWFFIAICIWRQRCWRVIRFVFSFHDCILKLAVFVIFKIVELFVRVVFDIFKNHNNQFRLKWRIMRY